MLSSVGLRTKLLLLFLLLMIISLANFGIIHQTEKNAAEQHEWVIHTHQVISTSEAMLGFLTDAETGQRGFLLTESPEYLKPYNMGVVAAEGSLRRLKQLTADNASQQTRLVLIKALMVEKFAELAETIRLTQNQHKSQALEIIESDRGQLIMDELRQRISAFVEEEYGLLEQREASYQALQSRLRWLFIIEICILAGIIFAIALYIQKILIIPLQKLTHSAEKQAAGQQVDDIEVSSSDELGRLAMAFNKMHRDVADREFELASQARFSESFSQVVSACTSGKRLEVMLSDALAINAHYHSVSLSAIYLKGLDEEFLHCLAVQGKAGRLAKRVPLTSGPLAQCYRDNISLTLEDDLLQAFLAKVDSGDNLGEGISDEASSIATTLMFKPIFHSDQVLGVLVVGYTHSVSDDDLYYMSNLTTQFGISIISAQRYDRLTQLTQALELKQQELIVERDKAIKSSLTDPLTRLYNRNYMQVELEKLIALSHRKHQSLSVIMADIDFFKRINDTFGHQSGDSVLVQFAQVLCEGVRESDFVSRYGGEEFLIALPQTPLLEAKTLAEKLRKQVEEYPFQTIDDQQVTVSLGVATLNGQGLDQLISQADQALYRAKHTGRNKVCFADLA